MAKNKRPETRERTTTKNEIRLHKILLLRLAQMRRKLHKNKRHTRGGINDCHVINQSRTTHSCKNLKKKGTLRATRNEK